VDFVVLRKKSSSHRNRNRIDHSSFFCYATSNTGGGTFDDLLYFS